MDPITQAFEGLYTTTVSPKNKKSMAYHWFIAGVSHSLLKHLNNDEFIGKISDATDLYVRLTKEKWIENEVRGVVPKDPREFYLREVAHLVGAAIATIKLESGR